MLWSQFIFDNNINWDPFLRACEHKNNIITLHDYCRLWSILTMYSTWLNGASPAGGGTVAAALNKPLNMEKILSYTMDE